MNSHTKTFSRANLRSVSWEWGTKTSKSDHINGSSTSWVSFYTCSGFAIIGDSGYLRWWHSEWSQALYVGLRERPVKQ
jgi:hypothetical protein